MRDLSKPGGKAVTEVFVFIALASALGGGLLALVVEGILPSGLALVSSASAAAAGITVTALYEGRPGLKRLLHRMAAWNVGILHWAESLFLIVPLVAAGSLVNPVFGGDFPEFSGLQPPFGLLPLFFVFVIVAGFGQELGFTGFLLPRLQRHFDALTSSILRAALSMIWYLPLLLYSKTKLPALSDFPYADWISQIGFPAAVAVFFGLFLVPWSILLTWMYQRTRGSLLLVSVFHGSEFWAAFWMLSTGISPKNVSNYWGYGLLLAAAAFVAVRISGAEHLSERAPKDISHPGPAN